MDNVRIFGSGIRPIGRAGPTSARRHRSSVVKGPTGQPARPGPSASEAVTTELGKDPTSDYAKIGDEFLQFLDTDRSAGWSHTLLKSVVDATIVDIPTP